MKQRQPWITGVVLIIGLVLATGGGWRLVTGPAASWAASSSAPTVTLSGERIEQSSPAVADFDGDGDQEIVVGGRDGMLYVIAYESSSWSVVWSRQTANDLNNAGAPSGSPCVTDKSDIRSAPAIADLDGDGHLEIVVTTGGDTAQHRNGGVLVYRHGSGWSFSVMSNWPQPKIDEVGSGPGSSDPDGCWDGIWSSPALGDLDGDGDLEVVVEGFDRRIHAWHHDGTVVNGWPIYRGNGDAILRGGWSSPALGDIDGDGLPEVVVGTDSPPWEGEGGPAPDYSKATVWAINGDSTNVTGWPVTTDNNVQSSPALGDIDNDGQLEVVVGSGPSGEGGNGHKVYAWNGDGSVVSGWPKTTGGDMPAPPALGDLDGDGDLEIVIGCGGEDDPYNPAPCTSLYAWHGNGGQVSGFPMTPDNPIAWDDANGLPYSPVLADYDGDGSIEILILNRWSWGLSTVEANGAGNNDPTLMAENTLASTPVVDDVDNDGKLEVVIGGADYSGGHGAVYVWGVTGSAGAARPWPMFHRDVARTGLYPPDSTPPTNPTVVTATPNPSTWTNDNTIDVTWSGATDTGSGVERYYYVWDSSPTTVPDLSASFVSTPTNSLTSSPLSDSANWYFHIRSRDKAGNFASGAKHLGPFQIDTTPPTSSASSPAEAVSSIAVSWSGSDSGSGIASYTVQVRQGTSGSWTDWLVDTAATSDNYGPVQCGQTYYFRSVARDQVGNQETDVDEDGDTHTFATTNYYWGGTVVNNVDEPVYGAQVQSASACASATTDVQGQFKLYYSSSGTYNAYIYRTGFGVLPTANRAADGSTDHSFVLPPSDNVIYNGHFETGSLSNWTVTGNAFAQPSGHTGQYDVAIVDSSTLSQAVTIPSDGVLSLMYYVYNGSAVETLRTKVLPTSGGTGLTLSLSPVSSWTHAWLDVSSLAGQSAEVRLEVILHGIGPTVHFDEVTVGSTVQGSYMALLPVILRSD